MSEKKSFSIDIQDENRINCNELVETVSLHEAAVLPTAPLIYLEKSRRMTVIITPTITTTDDVLRNVNPAK